MEAYESVPQTIEHEINGLTEDQLNSKTDCDDDYDPAFRFRQKVMDEGYKIEKLFAVYHTGWECDQWSCVASKDNKQYKIETSHGSLLEPKLLGE